MFLYAAVPYSEKKKQKNKVVRMEDAAHCRHTNLPLCHRLTTPPVLTSVCSDFFFLFVFGFFLSSPFPSVTCQGSVTFGCDCLVV